MIRVALIGCGSIARHRHAPEYAMNPQCEIIGYYDPEKERANELAREFGGKVFAELNDIFEDDSIDAVSVCTPNKYHAPVTIKALEAGMHVLCEKPIATTAEDGEKMIEAARKSAKFLMIAHNQRLAEAHVKARQLLQSGEMGRVLTFRTTFGHKGPEMWSADKGSHTWFFKRNEAFVGAMGDLGVHKADLIRWLLNDEIEEVMAYVSTVDKKDHNGDLIQVDDNAICLLRSRTGISGTLTASWTYYGDSDNSTVLYCTNGIMKIYDNPEIPLEITFKNGEKALYKVSNIQTNENQTKSGIIDMFVNSIVSGTPPEISGEEGLAALKIVLACLKSAETGRSIKVQDGGKI